MVSPENPGGAESLLEPAGHPAVGPYRDALVADGIPAAQFTVDDVQAEYDRLVGPRRVFHPGARRHGDGDHRGVL